MRSYDEKEIRNWLLLFYLKIFLLFFLLFVFIFSLLDAKELGLAALLPVPAILLLFFLIHRDIRNDPHGLLKFFGEAFRTWWYSNNPDQHSRLENSFSQLIRQSDLDIHREVKVPSRILKNGGYYTAKIKLIGICPRCDGDRTSDPGGILLVCSRCNGSGKGVYDSNKAYYFTQAALVEKCSDCYGTGYIPDKPCPQCKGTGEALTRKTVKMTIPPNTTQDSILRLRGMGLLDRDRGLVGDLLIKVKIKRLF